jgi:hypothetical protein
MIPNGTPTPAPTAAACELEPEDAADVVAAGEVVVAEAEVEVLDEEVEVEVDELEVDVLR